MAELVRGRPPRVPAAREPQAVSGIEAVYPADDNRPLFVGERTNVIGSRRVKELVVRDPVEEAPQNRRAPGRDGAPTPGGCLAQPHRAESGDTGRVLTQITPKGKGPTIIG